jgi:aminoglycoside 6-adenylyltransferase
MNGIESDSRKKDVLAALTQWAEKQAAVRAMLLTSTRTIPNAPLDAFSDYDVILVVTDIQLFLEDDSWLEDFGEVLVVYRDPVELRYGFERFIRVTQYEDGTKIDYTVWPIGLLKHIVAEPEDMGYLDDGYRVLFDKDNLTAGIKPPTYKIFIPPVPTEEEYQTVVNNFFSNSTYVAKYICRDDLIALKGMQDHMKSGNLLQMFVWQIEIDNDWSVKPGLYGKGLKKYLKPEIWKELENTYSGAGKDENWEELFGTIALFGKVAGEVGTSLGYAYPDDLVSRVVKYLHRAKDSEMS